MSELGPKIPNWLDQLQFIKFYAFNPCDVPFTAYIETAQPITTEIAMVFLGIDYVAFVKQLFKPKWARSKRHTRRGRRGKPRRGGVPEVADLLADTLDPDGHLAPRRWYLGLTLVAEWVEIQERIFWTIFLLEMADSLIINTLIGVIEGDKKGCPHIARALRSADFITNGGPGPRERTVNISHLNYNVGCNTPNGFYIQVPEGTFVAVYNGMMRAATIDTECTIKMRISSGGKEHYVANDTTSINTEDWKSFVLSERIEGPGAAFFLVDISVGFVEMTAVRGFMLQIDN